MISPVLANAYAATHAAPWHFQASTRSAAGGRARVWAWLHWVAGLNLSDAARVTGSHRSSVYHGLGRTTRPLVDPPESFRRAMACVQAPIWGRNVFGCLHKRRPFPSLRRRVWGQMRTDGCSFVEIGRMCGCSAAAVQEGLRETVGRLAGGGKAW